MKVKLKRADLERILIVCAAVLVVVLALRGGGDTSVEMVYEETPPDTAEVSLDAAGSGVETQSTVTETGIWCPSRGRFPSRTAWPRPPWH